MLAGKGTMFLKTRRKKFVDQHSVLPDEDFLRAVGARLDLARFVSAARRAVAEICHVPSEAIHPADAPATLASLATLDWDDLQVIMSVESELGVSLGEGLDAPRFLAGRFFWRSWPAPETFGEWVVQFAEWANKSPHATAAAPGS
jgi:hypothetical protein